MTSTVYFSDGTTLVLNDGDTITPVIQVGEPSDASPFASMAENIILCSNIHNGIVPSFLNVLLSCRFFYVNNNSSILYFSNSIVRIETA